MKKHFLVSLIAAALFLCAGTGNADAEGVAIVDTARIFSESEPGKAGEAHLQKAREILQKGMDDLRGMYKGKEKSAEAQNVLRDGYVALERQLAAEREAVRQVLISTLEDVIRIWLAVNKKYSVVLSRDMALGIDRSVDITDSVLKEMNKERPKFPALPTVTITPPQKSEAKQAPAAKAAPAPAKTRQPVPKPKQ